MRRAWVAALVGTGTFGCGVVIGLDDLQRVNALDAGAADQVAPQVDGQAPDGGGRDGSSSDARSDGFSGPRVRCGGNLCTGGEPCCVRQGNSSCSSNCSGNGTLLYCDSENDCAKGELCCAASGSEVKCNPAAQCAGRTTLCNTTDAGCPQGTTCTQNSAFNNSYDSCQ